MCWNRLGNNSESALWALNISFFRTITRSHTRFSNQINRSDWFKRRKYLWNDIKVKKKCQNKKKALKMKVVSYTPLLLSSNFVGVQCTLHINGTFEIRLLFLCDWRFLFAKIEYTIYFTFFRCFFAFRLPLASVRNIWVNENWKREHLDLVILTLKLLRNLILTLYHT